MLRLVQSANYRDDVSYDVSVLVPAYNHRDYIEDCIRSIWKQEGAALEILVIDDGSSDDTFERVKILTSSSQVPMRAWTRENKGVNQTLSELANASRGRFLLFLASDDMLATDAIIAVAPYFKRADPPVFIVGNGTIFGESANPSKRIYDSEMTRLFNEGAASVSAFLYSRVPQLLTQSTFIRRDFFFEIGGFDVAAKLDDWPYMIKIFRCLGEKNADWIFLDVDVVRYRRHGSNSSRSIRMQYDQVTDTVHRYLPEDKKLQVLLPFYRRLMKISSIKDPVFFLFLVWKVFCAHALKLRTRLDRNAR